MNCTVDKNCPNGYCKNQICKYMSYTRYDCHPHGYCSYEITFTETSPTNQNHSMKKKIFTWTLFVFLFIGISL